MLHVLLYADDLALMAGSPEELQSMLDCLAEFCEACCMCVNTTKLEVVCFNRRWAPKQLSPWRFNGKVVKVVEKFRYLGVWFEQSGKEGGVHMAQANQLASAKCVMASMWRRCYALKVHNVATLGYLFDALVRPVASYGCEIWSPDFIRKAGIGKGGIELLHNSFMRQAMQVRSSTPVPILLSELGRQPISWFWLRQCVKFWNRTVTRPDRDLVKLCLHENIDMAVSLGTANKQCWASCLLDVLSKVGIISQPHELWSMKVDGSRVLRRIDMAAVTAALQQLDQRAWQAAQQMASDPRRVPDDHREGFKLAIYRAWFCANGSRNKNMAFVAHVNRRDAVREIARFRMGCHQLDIEARRWGDMRVERSKRICRCCGLGKVEDELHFMLECPLYRHIRADFLLKMGVQSSNFAASNENMQRIANGRNEDEWKITYTYIREG